MGAYDAYRPSRGYASSTKPRSEMKPPRESKPMVKIEISDHLRLEPSLSKDGLLLVDDIRSTYVLLTVEDIQNLSELLPTFLETQTVINYDKFGE